ncbi:TPA: AAA family ATPase [Vibrio cholerae]|uniref:McrB family protein n=1 Tax=Vibrio cholerae TaxID=666 RepID=UPI000615BE75|nr:AAA family ATPase [Vibrio cholerae]AKB06526.1 AAA domain family protein [Vibrio cholerae]GHY92376.1 AAA domain family protein [Vibrio cholerae]
MRYQELISTYPVNQFYEDWSDSTKAHFQHAMHEISEVLGGFDVWSKTDGRSLRCGFKELSAKKGKHLIHISLRVDRFQLGLNYLKCTEGDGLLKSGEWETDFSKNQHRAYFNWYGNDYDKELSELIAVLSLSQNKASLKPNLPSFGMPRMPVDYEKYNLLVSKFAGVKQFVGHYSKSSEETKRAFCDIIFQSRTENLDCYPTNKGNSFNIRLGRKELDSERSDRVFAEFNPSSNGIHYEIRFVDGVTLSKDKDSERPKGAVDAKAVLEFQKHYSDEFKQTFTIERAPYWPSDYNSDSSDSSETTEQPSKESSMQTPSLNQILFGPPGTGKTYHTIEKAVQAAEPNFKWNNRKALKTRYDELVADNRIRFVTFHQSYGYEEFVEGLSVEVKNEKPHYFVKDGIFKRIVHDALKSFEEDSDTQNYVLVIDEINRGNISKIFGELITLIEESKRRKGNDETNEVIELDLPYSGEKFSVPNNLFLIGTMNTADRSLAVMDTALRRRFDFIEMMPDSSVLTPKSSHADFKIDLVKLLDTMNARIEYLLDREHTLGHAFFIPVVKLLDNNKPTEAFLELKKVFQNKVLPLLQEYFFDDWHKIRLVLGDNQKNNQKLEFVTSQPVELIALLGSGELNQFGESEKKFVLSKHDSAVWSDFNAYKGIYEAVS